MAEPIEIIEEEGVRYVRRKNFISISFLDPKSISDFTSFDEQIAKLLVHPANIVINTSFIKEPTPEWIKVLQALQVQLGAMNKKLICNLTNRQVTAKLAEPESGNPVDIAPDFSYTIDFFETEEGKMSNTHFIKAFVNATIRALFVQGQTLSKRGDIFVNSKDPDKLEGDISGLVHVRGSNFSYTVLILFPKNTFLSLMSRIFEEEYVEITDDIKDGATEFINIIFGGAKRVLNIKKAGIELTLPLLIMGDRFPDSVENRKELHFDSFKEGKTIVVPFSSDIGPFYVRVWFPKNLDIGEVFKKSGSNDA